MALVDYDSSEESDCDAQQKPAQTSTKPKPSNKAIPKLVDSSNPGKIRVDVGTLGGSKKDEDWQESERPVKRAKLGGGGLSDFNSLLPAPKRPAATNGGRGPGLGRGVNLKTGAAPGFSREPMVEHGYSVQDAAGQPEDFDPSSTETQNGTSHAASAIVQAPGTIDGIPELPKKEATMFKPLSVSRKPQKKKQPPPAPNPSATATPPSGDVLPRKAPNASLFSVASEPQDDHDPIYRSAANKSYQPMLYQPEHPDPDPPPATEIPPDESSAASAHPPQDQDQDQSLESIATSLNLTPSQKRQLFGRNASKSASSQQAIKVTNFNTDAEYASNEALRQAGEAVQHQPVRAITGGGKHSLKQLVSSAVGQKDALDQSFADGMRNPKEGAAKYGW